MKCFEIGKEYQSNDFIVVPLKRIVNSRGKVKIAAKIRRGGEEEEIRIFNISKDRGLEVAEYCYSNKYMTAIYPLEVSNG